MITVSNTSLLDTVPFVNGTVFKSSSIFNQSQPIIIPRPIKSKLIKKQKVSPRFEIEFPDFDYKFNFEIIDINVKLSASEIVFYLKFDDNIIKAVLSGKRKVGEGLYIDNFGFGVEKQGETPVSAFLLKTLWAMLGLSEQIQIQIPSLNQKATISFDTKISEITDLLEIKRVAYRLMVIEKAFRIRLPFPQFIDSKDIGNIAYCYHSVVDRKFEWLCPPAIIPWFATPMYLSLIPKKNVPFPMQYGPEPFEKEIFGYSINLGLQLAKIEAYVLDNFDEVKKKLSKLDGSEVLAQARSKRGVMQIESITTPMLPKNAFSPEIQKLIDLEDKLIDATFKKHINSFSNAFEGLSDEQIEVLTERPTLEEEAFNF